MKKGGNNANFDSKRSKYSHPSAFYCPAHWAFMMAICFWDSEATFSYKSHLSDCYRLYIGCKNNIGKALNYQTDLSDWYQLYIEYIWLTNPIIMLQPCHLHVTKSHSDPIGIRMWHPRSNWSAYAVYVQCTCSVSEVYLQPSLQIHSMYWNVSAVCTAGHCRYTAVRSGII